MYLFKSKNTLSTKIMTEGKTNRKNQQRKERRGGNRVGDVATIKWCSIYLAPSQWASCVGCHSWRVCRYISLPHLIIFWDYLMRKVYNSWWYKHVNILLSKLYKIISGFLTLDVTALYTNILLFYCLRVVWEFICLNFPVKCKV